jgi:DNA-binding PadR family transcriptional regulator
MLGALEQLVLLAILRAGKNAYGVTIADEIEEHTGRTLTMATIYKTLSRLEDKEYVRTTSGAPTAIRGGKAKRYYTLTKEGRQELRDVLTSLQRMAPGLDLGVKET